MAAPLWIRTPEELDALVVSLRRARALSIDTEADGLHHYPVKLCLVQVAADRGRGRPGAPPPPPPGSASPCPRWPTSGAVHTWPARTRSHKWRRWGISSRMRALNCPSEE